MNCTAALMTGQEFRRHRNRGMWHICKWCGEEYEGEPLGDRFCSGECWQDHDAYEIEMDDLFEDWGGDWGFVQ